MVAVPPSTPEIRQATNFKERAKAVDFVLSIARPDMMSEDRRKEAIIHGLPAGPSYAIDSFDVDLTAPFKMKTGPAKSPIWTVHRDGELVGAVACSCVVWNLPLRLMMHAVREDFQRRGIGGALVRHVIASAPVVSVAVGAERLDRKAYLTHVGFRFWYKSAWSGWVGASRPINKPEGLIYAVPVATDAEVPCWRFLLE